jgi:FAD/FMN-containing dehydrogenase
VEFGAETKNAADDQARALMDALKKTKKAPSMKLFDDPEQERTIWLVRRSGLGATARVPNAKDTWEGWEDSAVPPEKLGNYLRDLRKLLTEFGYACALYGHFGQGCVHTRIDFDLVSKAALKNIVRSSIEPRISLSATADRSRASMATDNRAASCYPKCSVRN